MATVSNPISHSVSSAGFSDAGWRYTYVLEGLIREKLMDSFSLMDSGLVPLAGDVAGSGSDTIRLRYLDAIGYGLSMASMGAENTAITPSALTATTSDITVGRYGLQFNNTYTNQIQATAGEVDMERLAASIVLSRQATWMDLLATTVTGADTDSGQSGVDASVDDLLDATYYFDTLEGPTMPFAIIHGQQWRDLKASFRNEPAFQFPDAAEDILTVNGGPGFKGVHLVPIYVSSRITSSGGNRHGALVSPGAIEYAIGSTASIRPASVADTVNLSDLGLIIEFSGTPGSATSTVTGNQFMGMAEVDGEMMRGFVTDA